MHLYQFFGEGSTPYEFPEDGEQELELSSVLTKYVEAYVRENPDVGPEDVAVEMGRFAFAAGRAYQADEESLVTLRISADAASNLISRLLQDPEDDE
jgi:hypothetical protein